MVDTVTVVARIGAPPTVVVVPGQVVSALTQSNKTPTVIEVFRGPAGAQGPQGLQGPIGPSGSGALPAYTFHFGDASPATVFTLSDAREIVLISLQVEEAFDGVGATASLGVTGQPELLMPAVDGALGTVGIYEFSPREELDDNTPIIITIVPGSGASTGRGQLVIETSPIP